MEIYPLVHSVSKYELRAISVSGPFLHAGGQEWIGRAWVQLPSHSRGLLPSWKASNIADVQKECFLDDISASEPLLPRAPALAGDDFLPHTLTL